MNSVQVLCVSRTEIIRLDATSVHPESYAGSGRTVEEAGIFTVDDIKGGKLDRIITYDP